MIQSFQHQRAPVNWQRFRSSEDGGHREPAIHKGDPEGILVPGKRNRNTSGSRNAIA
ncbi:hypothetical protein BJV78DRAFT_1254224 [Lactifluus subvellereus]|nr:hypothetical protein BJV78DRAFT_1267609 [Lactifluus subvellereus]KAI0246482.1 hypothetical protein BJV78DRAFT_1254224 [Lactifluus subvellereus]